MTLNELKNIIREVINENNKTIIYTAIFFDTNEVVSKYKQVHPNLYSHHSTIEFKPKDISNLPIGEEFKIRVIGRLTNDKVDVLIIENQLSKNKYPHITLSTAEGIKPFQSNSEIENNLDKIIPANETLTGIIGYFDGSEITKLQEEKKADRCLRIARRKNPQTSAYRSGLVVQCRKGKIWKGLKEEEEYKYALIKIIKPLAYMDKKYEYQLIPYNKLNNKLIDVKKGSSGHKMISKNNIEVIEIGSKEELEEKLNGLLNESKKTNFSKEKEKGLHGWFERQGGKGKSKGWVDCNTCRKDPKTGRKKCKTCGRQEGEKRAKYPACRPTPSDCSSKGKGKSWGKKSAN